MGVDWHGRTALGVDPAVFSIQPDEVEEEHLCGVVLADERDDILGQRLSDETTGPRVCGVPFSTVLVKCGLSFSRARRRATRFRPRADDELGRTGVGEEDGLDGGMPCLEIGFSFEEANDRDGIGGKLKVAKVGGPVVTARHDHCRPKRLPTFRQAAACYF
jgi:hypothetical protein